MGKLPLILFMCGTLFPVFGQRDLKRADIYFERAFYSDAIPLYEQLLPKRKGSKLVKNLAESYYRTYDMKGAARWYGYLVNQYGENVDDTHYFKLTQSLKALGDYEQANSLRMDMYVANDQAAKIMALKEEIKYLDNIRAIGNRYTITNLPLNTATSEFGALRVDSMLMYSAARKKPQSGSRLYRWNNQNYLDIYTHPLDKTESGDSLSVSLSKVINSGMHEGTFTLTKNRKTIYFTRNTDKKQDDKKIGHLKIFKAQWQDGEWRNVTELPFNGKGFSTEHPVLNTDETKLYFASDRAGGYGSFDLYYVPILQDSTYGTPVNLGKHINTAQREQFPFLDQKGHLYFSSDGHPGYGLLDLFVARNENGEFQKPDNLGLPVNSGYDDFSMTLDQDGRSGYFASNRPGGKGSDDIYAFTEEKPLIIEDCKQFITGRLTDKVTALPIIGGEVRLIDAKGNVTETHISGEEASYQFQVACASSYRLEGIKEGYETNATTIITGQERNLKKDGSLQLMSLEELLRRKALALQKEKEETRKREAAEKEKKEREKALAEVKRQKALKEQQIAAEKEKKSKIEKAIQKEDALVRDKERLVIKTEEIHFDYSMWYLRRESRERLGNVIKVMQENPGMVLEIGSHTDIRGKSEYNRQLSQRRADSVKEYLVKNGIPEDHVIAKGYGESQPIVECPTLANCTEEDHEWNRRCEFVIVDWK
ncbi:MAG: OmpA family protein [Bacteroidota bacterium]